MGDFDRRNFRNGPHFNRKRRYRDDGDSDRRAPKRRYEEPLQIKLRKQLLGLAESPTRNVDNEIANAAKNAIEIFSNDEHRSNLVALTTQLVFEQPPKIPFLASFVMACNLERPELAQVIIETVGSSVQKHMQAGAWRQVKLGLRMLSCLQGILEADGVFPILEELFSRAVDLQTTSSEDALGLELVKIILTSIAYLMASPADGFEERAVGLLEKTDIIASTPHALDALVQQLPGFGDTNDRQPQSVIGVLQRSLQTEAVGKWDLNCLPRPWKGMILVNAEGETVKHALPAITVPTPAPLGHCLRFPELYFSVYSDQEAETVPTQDHVASVLVHDLLSDTINILDFNRNATAKSLIDVDCFFAPGTFASRGTPFDKLKDIPEGKSTWKPEDVAVDAVFSQLFQLPSPEHKLIYFHSVLTEACKLAPAAIAPSLGRAIRYLYKNLDVMDLELQYRFLDWFSHHLSNFGFTWKWTEWADDLELPSVHVKKAFITGLLEKEIRLSVVQRVQGTLPETFHPLLPDLKEEDQPPDFKYANDDAMFALEAREALRLIKNKAPDSEVQTLLDNIQKAAPGMGFTEPFLAAVDVYTTCICFAGSKSLSHLLSYVERCKDRLLTMSAASEAARHQILTSVMSYWSEKPGTGINIVDKLLNYSILSPMSVIQWVFDAQLQSQGGVILIKAYIYELVAATIRKVANRLRQIVGARKEADLSKEQAAQLDQTLQQEQLEMQGLFAVIEGRLQALIDSPAEAIGFEHTELRNWGKRWLRVFQRRAQVERSWREQELQEHSNKDTDMHNGGHNEG